jgi:hypothetical protein
MPVSYQMIEKVWLADGMCGPIKETDMPQKHSSPVPLVFRQLA